MRIVNVISSVEADDGTQQGPDAVESSAEGVVRGSES